MMTAKPKEIPIDPTDHRVTDDAVLSTAIMQFKDDYAALYRDHPRYWAILSILHKYWSADINTFAVRLTNRRTHELLINPLFYLEMDEQERRLAVLMHECHHIVLGHCDPAEWPAHVHEFPDCWTIACELAANTHVRLKLPVHPARPILPKQFGLAAGLTTMEYFRLLLEDYGHLKRKLRNAVRKLGREATGKIIREKEPKPSDGDAASGEGDLNVLRAVAEVGEDERSILEALDPPIVLTESRHDDDEAPDAGAVDSYYEPSDEWLAEHSLGIDGTITDEHVFKAMLNELVRDTTKGYSLGGSFRFRTFKRRSRRCPEGFGILGIRRSGGAAASRLDLVFLVDATSSMSPYIKNVANSLYWMT
ncbi:MAG: hypothetical protein KAV00_09350, partial [Phycisphaerae bacterium]|nr:hypothetical protein [Phycisphaerae bacterium]